MLDGQYETDPYFATLADSAVYYGPRLGPPRAPLSAEEQLIEIWERRQGRELGPRRAEFLARPEVPELLTRHVSHLADGAKHAMAANPDHHLLLTEWRERAQWVADAEQRSRARPSTGLQL